MTSTGHAKPKVIYVDVPLSALVVGQPESGKKRHTNDHDAQRNQTASPNQKHAPLCVVCEKRPHYSKRGKTYPTCGLTCAQKLASGNGPRGMCWVCGVRPGHSTESKFRTCGIECNEKLKDDHDSVRMCDYCHQRPKYHDGKNIYPQCNMECKYNSTRNMANRRPAGLSRLSAPSETNSACLLCWNVAMTPGADLCKNCSDVAAQIPGLLLEAPRGHATFNNVAVQFTTAWDNGGQCPDVLEVYKVLEPPSVTADFTSYRDKIKATGHFDVSRGNECRRWHGTTRECDDFDPGDLNVCFSQSCMMCSTIRNSFDLKIFSSGIYTSSTSRQSSVHSGSSRGRKIALLVDVAVGKVIELTPDENLHRGRPDNNTVNLIKHNSSGQRVECDELVIFHKDAVRPLYIIVYG